MFDLNLLRGRWVRVTKKDGSICIGKAQTIYGEGLTLSDDLRGIGTESESCTMAYVELDTVEGVDPGTYQCSCPAVQIITGQERVIEVEESARAKKRLEVKIEIQIVTEARRTNWNSGIDIGAKAFADQAFQTQLNNLQASLDELEA